jgi:hydrogenase-4 component B
LTELFRLALRTRVRLVAPTGLFPSRAMLVTETPDVFREAVFGPAFVGIRRALDRLRILQHGRIQLYVLYVVLTLVALMVWTLR